MPHLLFMDILYAKNVVEILLNKEHSYLRINWEGKVAKQDYIDALEFCIQYLQERDINKILVDQRQILPLTPDEQAWLVRSWFPRFLDPIGGRAYLAIISSQMTFRDLSSKSIAKRLLDKYHDLTIQYFSAETPAIKFIENPEL